MEEEKSRNSDLFSVKNISVGLLIVLLLPIPISLIISSGNWLSFIDGNSSIWIGFWGSYLGGVVGTAGVIYVAHLQNNAQKESMETIERNNLKRLRVQTLLKLLDDYNEEVSDLLNHVISIQYNVNKIIENMNELNKMNLTKAVEKSGTDYDDSRFRENINQHRKKLLDMKLTSKYITKKLGKLEYKNITLTDQGVGLSEKLSGLETVYMDKIIEEIYSNNFSELALNEIIKEAKRCKKKNYSRIYDWLLREQSLIHNASSHLLDELSHK